MVGRRPPQAVDQRFCRRCQLAEPSITVRSEPLCKACFAKYVQSKVVKRMESFRVRHSDPGHERKLLLPVFLDACSTGLLHILSQHLKGQIGKTGRTGFKICVLYLVDDIASDPKTPALFGELESRYPEHSYYCIPLSNALSKDVFQPFPFSADHGATALEQVTQLLDAQDSATSRQDLKQILRRRLTIRYAKEMACEAVVWSDSTTALAERTLAETAKGRGQSLPWIISDGDSPHGVPFYYPLRELLTKEIDAYVSFLEPPFDQSLTEHEDAPAVSTKNVTIDGLMKQYFASVEREYPSIVANVVRTAGKLHVNVLTEIEKQCELCELPLEDRAPERSRLCYGCIRLLPRSSG